MYRNKVELIYFLKVGSSGRPWSSGSWSQKISASASLTLSPSELAEVRRLRISARIAARFPGPWLLNSNVSSKAAMSFDISLSRGSSSPIRTSCFPFPWSRDSSSPIRTLCSSFPKSRDSCLPSRASWFVFSWSLPPMRILHRILRSRTLYLKWKLVNCD